MIEIYRALRAIFGGNGWTNRTILALLHKKFLKPIISQNNLKFDTIGLQLNFL